VQLGSKYKPLDALYCATLLLRNRVQIHLTGMVLFVGWGDPTKLLGGLTAKKWGRSSPTRCFARDHIDRRAMRNLY